MRGKIVKSNFIWAVVGGIVFSPVFVLGFLLETYGNVNYKSLGLWGALLLAAALFAGLLYALFSVKLPDPRAERAGERKHAFRFFGIALAALTVVYIVWALGTYPGYFAYDAAWQWFMYSEHNITEHHPVLHTLMIGWFMDLGQKLTGTYIKGIFMLVLLQIGLSVLSFACALTFLYVRRASKKLIAFAFLWMAFAPTVVINVLAVTKDSVFALLSVPFVILTVQMAEDGKRFFSKWYNYTAWGLLAFFSAIMRNNAIYPMVLLLAVFVFVNRAHWKKYLAVVMGIVILYCAYKGPFVSAFTDGEMDREEYFSIPLQQILWVYMNDRDRMTQEERDVVEELFTEKSFTLYHPRIADTPKYDFDIDGYYENPGRYQRFWANLGLRFPADYFNAFLENNFGLWYPWATLVLDLNGRVAYAVCHSYDPIANDSLIPPIYRYYLLFEDSGFVCRNNWTRWIFAPATYFCFFLTVFLTALCKKKKSAYALGYLLVFWLTFLLGPVALVRYVSFLFYLFPVFLWMLSDMLRGGS